MRIHATLYDTDFYAWVQDQAALLAARRFEELDLPHLVEELQLLGNSERGELPNRLSVLLAHLLKLQVAAERLPYVYDRARRSWHLTCTEQRLQLRRLLRRNPSLRPSVPDELPDVYAIARLHAAIALGVDEACWPGEGAPHAHRDVCDDVLCATIGGKCGLAREAMPTPLQLSGTKRLVASGRQVTTPSRSPLGAPQRPSVF